MRRRSLSESALIATALAALAVRAFEMPLTTLGIVRIAISLVVIAFVCFAPAQTLARRAMAVLIGEALVGTLAFALVDVPLVVDHQRQIGTTAVAIVRTVDRFERVTALRR